MDVTTRPTLIALPAELRTERAILRPYTLADGEAVYAAIDESRGTLEPWMPWVHNHKGPDDGRDFCARAASSWLTRTSLDLGIFDARDGRYLGGTGYPRLDWAIRSFEIGYWIRSSAEGHGYVREAVQALTRLAFEELGANRVEIRCDARNTRSSNVAERLDFVREARLRNESLDPAGRLRDSLVFALIPEDYARVKREWWPGEA